MLLTQAAYAGHRGCSRAYISQMVKRGKIPLTADGKIDPVAADAALGAHADPNMAPVAAYHAAQRAPAQRGSTDVPAQPPEAPDAPAMGPGRYVETPMSRAKAADAIYSAKTKQLEYERAVGKLVETAEVARAIAEVAPALQQFDSIPDRLIDRLLAETDRRKAHTMLADELANCRQAVADFARTLIERLTARTQ